MKNEKKVKLVRAKIWCNSSIKFYDYIIVVDEKHFCIHCVLEGHCDELFEEEE